MRVRGHFWGGGLARTDRPNWFVRKQNTRELVLGQRVQTAFKLAFQDGMGEVRFPLREAFADANDRASV